MLLRFHSFIPVLLFATILISCQKNELQLQTDSFEMLLNERGQITSFTDKQTATQFSDPAQISPLLAVRSNDVIFQPYKATWNDDSKTIMLYYESSGLEVTISYRETESHIAFEITEITGDEPIDIALWGPFATTLRDVVGETVGVVQNLDYAIGIQALNLKTLGGYPTNEDDTEPAYNIFATSSYVDVADSVNVIYRGQTARHTPTGSVLQAYTRDRSAERIIPVWGHEHYVVPPFDDGGIIGSKIALFGSPAENVLATIEKIVLEEGLPYPTLNNEWIKTSAESSASYIIHSFSENNLDTALELTKAAGLKYLYHGDPFRNWGHFDLKEEQFPDNWDSMKRAVERADQEGIRLGVHTLSNFITTNDPYVSPVPDSRLAKVGSSILSSSIDASQTTIEIDDPIFFNQMSNNNLQTVTVGNELIRYSRVSGAEPWLLMDCERGAFGTNASSHEAGSEISKLMDHDYRVFLSNQSLSEEIAIRLADLFNYTGLRQISFDGLEGNWSTGMGQYGRQLFVNTWYSHLNPELQNDMIMDASNPGHYFWHKYTRMNWGEPWYAGFRESQTQYRLLNQDYFSRNLMPRMLGWFSMTDGTGIEDIEWLLARAAGFDAGFAMVTSPEIVSRNGVGPELIQAINNWETLRMAGSFPEEIKVKMRDVKNEFHLQKRTDETYQLHQYHIQTINHRRITRQPGEPVWSEFLFDNPYREQNMQLVLHAPPATSIHNIFIEIGNSRALELDIEIPAGGFLRIDDKGIAAVYNSKQVKLRETEIPAGRLIIYSGGQKIKFDCGFQQPTENSVRIEFKTMDDGILITL
ncbi:MAG: hypothetical protein EA359_08680 [Balneolaceae bacterium]|nr:MAG: hypothetical protein EA359_08680 [Balneolaceae bacterium]